MEDYIFLIIAIVLSIFGAINQNKKKKIENNAFLEAEEKPRNGFMDQLLGADFLNEPEVEKAPPVRMRRIKALLSYHERNFIIRYLKARFPTGPNTKC